MNTELWERFDMLPAGARVLCAVSGGTDSMCLLHLLRSLEEERGITVIAAHYEHGLRGEESLRDQAFVRAVHLTSYFFVVPLEECVADSEDTVFLA